MFEYLASAVPNGNCTSASGEQGAWFTSAPPGAVVGYCFYGAVPLFMDVDYADGTQIAVDFSNWATAIAEPALFDVPPGCPCR
mmetsp:Transcript_1892/g.6753  ORF Transcript_1892/g.6753 Transcript_1892/m.6753 type:complete len:83 (+) Transcript_1892:449-697(+)